MNDEERSDEELMEAFYACNSGAFDALEAHWRRPLEKFLYAGCSNYVIAEDLAQEILIKAYVTKDSKSGRFCASKGSFRSWIFCIARRCLIDWFRHPRPDPEVPPPEEPPDWVKNLILRLDLLDCVEKLPLKGGYPWEREFIELWELGRGELSQQEIAERWKRSDAYVTKVKSDALRHLRECMAANGYS